MFYKMDRIYHGCMTKNADGTNRLIGPDEKFVKFPICRFLEAQYLLILASLSRSKVEGVNLTFFL